MEKREGITPSKLAAAIKLYLLLCVLLVAGAAHGGTIRGVVGARAHDGAGPQEGFGAGLYASRKFKFAERINYDELKDFVVYIKGPVPGSKPPEQPAVVRQKDAMFVPHILPVMVGTKVEWPNEDEIFHNVFSKSDAKSFDLDLYKKGDPPKVVTFDQVGKVDVYCSIHAKMSCVVLVLENSCFAQTDGAGRYVITNVPAGTYELVSWQERLPNAVKTVIVPADGEVTADFMMGVANLPKY